MTKHINTYLKITILLAFSLAVSNSAFSQKERKDIRRGNKVFEKALGDSGYVDTIRMQTAEAYYRNALTENINSFEGGFNLGASLFKQQKFSEAADQYKILTSYQTDKDKLAQVYHNLGNSLFMDGKLQESIEAYKSSLRISPADTTTRYNLAAAQKLLEDMKNNPDKQQQDQDQNQDQNKEDQEKQEQQQQQEQDQEKQEQEEKEQQQAQEDEKGEDGEEKEAMKPDEISKEDAERLLQAIQQDEKELQEKLKKEKAKAKRIRVEKEW